MEMNGLDLFEPFQGLQESKKQIQDSLYKFGSGGLSEQTSTDNRSGKNMFLWIKALHVLAIISWMAALLYLPRLFVYHSQSPSGSKQSEIFKIMERRLLNAIMTPAMVVAWGTGCALIWMGGYMSESWLIAKLAFVTALTVSHLHMGVLVRRFADDKNDKSHKYYRVLNEIPTVLMIGIVIFVIVKPF